VREWQRRRLSAENSLSQFTPVRGELDHRGQQPRLHVGADHEGKLVAAGGGGGLPPVVVAADGAVYCPMVKLDRRRKNIIFD
jgi:hypothetical protein